MVCDLLKWDGELVGSAWFTWDMGWKLGLWWHMINQMGDGTITKCVFVRFGFH
jgi:hypothetical protein